MKIKSSPIIVHPTPRVNPSPNWSRTTLVRDWCGVKSNVKTVAIVGVGLIGGSIGLALKAGRNKYRVIGIGRRSSSLGLAKKRGVVDETTLSLNKGVKKADLVILATPVNTIIRQIKSICEFIPAGAIVTDVGSTKSQIVREAEKVLKNRAFFVGAHPLTGSEKRGVAEARPDIFRDTVCILTPTSRTNRRALEIVRDLWKNLGAEVRLLSPADHDRIVARVSHLPHIISIALCHSLPLHYLDYVSGGFKDTTRIAMSDARLWVDICFSNKEEIRKSLNQFIKKLNRVEKYLVAGNKINFSKLWQKAVQLRKRC